MRLIALCAAFSMAFVPAVAQAAAAQPGIKANAAVKLSLARALAANDGKTKKTAKGLPTGAIVAGLSVLVGGIVVGTVSGSSNGGFFFVPRSPS